MQRVVSSTHNSSGEREIFLNVNVTIDFVSQPLFFQYNNYYPFLCVIISLKFALILFFDFVVILTFFEDSRLWDENKHKFLSLAPSLSL